jgi:hypothetical protein
MEMTVPQAVLIMNYLQEISDSRTAAAEYEEKKHAALASLRGRK